MPPRHLLSLALALALALTFMSCSDGSEGSTGDADASDPTETSSTDASVDAALDAPPTPDADAGADLPEDTPSPELDAADIEEDTSAPLPPRHYICDALGLPARPFEEGDPSSALYGLAADLLIPTADGDWGLAAEWAGCESLLFVPDRPLQNTGWPPMFERDWLRLLSNSPLNTQYFFVSIHEDPEERAASLALAEAGLEEAFTKLNPDMADWWRERVHLVTEPAVALPVWLGDVLSSPGWGVGIDRAQRIRYVGSFADPSRYDGAMQWFGPNLSMVANEARYYDFEAERQARLDETTATEVTLFDDEVISDPDWAGVKGYAEVTLPSADEMAGFDTLELDLYLGCVGDGEYGDCPAWDYIAELYLCQVDASDTCDVEVGRWITTYHREGRWVHDVSGLLPYLDDGGARRFAFYTQQPYEVTLTLRLSSGGKDARPVQAVPLFGGGHLSPEYSDKYDPVIVPIPADVTRVELATYLTGHGMSEPGNCAEFCNITHEFLVNDHAVTLESPEAGSPQDCMNKVSEGTVPNQYGTWWYGRSGWCPGKEVQLVMTDVTDHVTPGADATLDYGATFYGQPYTGPDARIQLTSWLVLSR